VRLYLNPWACFSSAALTLPLDVQAEEECFDSALLEELQKHVVPHIGTARVPDHLVSELARILHGGSQVYVFADVPPYESTQPDKTDVSDHGSTELGQLVPRERFSYWCFDLLFLICSRTPESESLLMK